MVGLLPFVLLLVCTQAAPVPEGPKLNQTIHHFTLLPPEGEQKAKREASVTVETAKSEEKEEAVLELVTKGAEVKAKRQAEELVTAEVEPEAKEEPSLELVTKGAEVKAKREEGVTAEVKPEAPQEPEPQKEKEKRESEGVTVEAEPEVPEAPVVEPEEPQKEKRDAGVTVEFTFGPGKAKREAAPEEAAKAKKQPPTRDHTLATNAPVVAKVAKRQEIQSLAAVEEEPPAVEEPLVVKEVNVPEGKKEEPEELII